MGPFGSSAIILAHIFTKGYYEIGHTHPKPPFPITIMNIQDKKINICNCGTKWRGPLLTLRWTPFLFLAVVLLWALWFLPTRRGIPPRRKVTTESLQYNLKGNLDGYKKTQKGICKDFWVLIINFSNLERITVSLISLYNTDLFLQ